MSKEGIEIFQDELHSGRPFTYKNTIFSKNFLLYFNHKEKNNTSGLKQQYYPLLILFSSVIVKRISLWTQKNIVIFLFYNEKLGTKNTGSRSALKKICPNIISTHFVPITPLVKINCWNKCTEISDKEILAKIK